MHVCPVCGAYRAPAPYQRCARCRWRFAIDSVAFGVLVAFVAAAVIVARRSFQ